MSDCIFCRIIKGEIPSSKVYEDENVFAFLDIGPLSWGHVLIVPKKHAEAIAELSSGESSAQAVPHLHGHLIPRVAGDGLGYRWNAKKYPEGEMKAWHRKVLDAMK